MPWAQVLWSPDGNFLYTGARRDGDIICWDVRGSLEPLYRMQRDTRSTNQRIQFSIEPCGRHLATGTADGVIAAHCASFCTVAIAAIWGFQDFR